MRDEVSIGPVPTYEAGTPVKTGENYLPQMRRECQVFKRQLERQFSDIPFGASFRIKSNPHDFGDYLEVVVSYDAESEEAAAFAYRIEDETPTEWDEEARKELGLVA